MAKDHPLLEKAQGFAEFSHLSQVMVLLQRLSAFAFRENLGSVAEKMGLQHPRCPLTDALSKEAEGCYESESQWKLHESHASQ